MQKKRIIILGTGTQAEVFTEYFQESDSYEIVAYTAEKDFALQDKFKGLPLICLDEIEKHYPPSDFEMIVAAGYRDMNRIRERLFYAVKEKGYRLISYVHPSVKLWKNNKIGENVFIFEDNTIQSFVEIGDDTVLWSGNHIGHHSIVGKHCFISSHVVISGKCKIGDNCFIGVNATLRDSITIGSYNLIGAGSLIMKTTKDKEVYLPERTKPHKLTTDSIKV